MFQFTISIFLSAFLLFQVQPMIGKFILPWFGGTPAVWSTAMLFFQVFLTGGYAYAYWLVKQKRQGWIHAGLLTLTSALLIALGVGWPSPVTPSADWKPAIGLEMPIPQLFILLTISVGLPYFVLAANSPLMQAWFSALFPKQSYARLYSLSNIGSLTGLLAYPLIIEPSLSLQSQGWAWSVGFLVFAVLVGWVGLSAQDRQRPVDTDRKSKVTGEKPTISMMALWVILGAIASVFLLATTNQITQEVAVIPFLWILPLALYLLSFILAFSDGPWIQRRLYALLFALSSLAVLYAQANTETLNIILQIVAYSALLFLACMIAHGELYLLRPASAHLTTFYLMVSVGGALGGIFVNLVAPFIFTGYWEFYLAWLLVFIILIVSLLPRWDQPRIRSGVLWASFVVATLAIMVAFNPYSDALVAVRNFYGVIRVREWQSPNGLGDGNTMVHGATVHGIQYSSSELRNEPTTYYSHGSGIGLVLLNHPKHGTGMRVGVLGLGVGTVAVYAEEGDVYRFYEINPVVVDYANGKGGYFSFLKDSKAEVTVVTDDARLALERELAEGELQDFDVLLLDTFSSDSIPVHLITKEAFGIYLRHLDHDGILAVHVSNRHIDLYPVLFGLAQEYGLASLVVDAPAQTGTDAYPTRYAILSPNPASLKIPELQVHAAALDNSFGTVRLWTDDYSNLFQILR
ncbi:MAG: fused MFS/spermidine synthase [Anaerolineales bacterium]|nr:fused MFS/spermidine synthase [Anaerolineales bacterium]